MSEISLPKQLTALNGQLIGQVYLTEYRDEPNTWHYDVLSKVPMGIDKLYGRRESLIDGERYAVVAGNGGYAKRSIAVQHCVIKLGELAGILTWQRKGDVNE